MVNIMTMSLRSVFVLIPLCGIALITASCSGAPEGETVDMPIVTSITVAPADAKAQAIVAAATAFLTTLTPEQREAVVFPVSDNAQRARWSNFPSGIFERQGLARGKLSAPQNAALDRLLAEVLSERGMRNAKLQIAADETLKRSEGGDANLLFGSALYNVSFVGEPRVDRPWTLQFGGHHLAINATFAGPAASFSPMLTGGQPLTVEFEGQRVYITRDEVEAARALLASLQPAQKSAAVRGDTAIQLVLGPGSHGTTIAPEGVRGSALTPAQQQLLLALIEARVGQFNARDAAAKMAEVRAALSDTYFAWWGPEQPFGAAYFRVTSPSLVLEYSPQKMGDDDPTEHAHNMYRDPTNDYGSRWLRTAE